MAKVTEKFKGLTEEELINKYHYYVDQRTRSIEFLTKCNAVIEFLEFELNALTVPKEKENEPTDTSGKD